MIAIIRQYLPPFLDILLISALFYRVYMVVRGTRLAQVAHLLAGVLGAAFLAELLGLYTVVWLIDRLWLWGIVLIVILFQAEIKQLALRVAYRSRFFGGSPVEMRRLVSDVTDAVQRLASSQRGATLVIQRDDPLDDVLNTGTRVEAVFSHELLMAIYSEESPLRDGAVLIGNRRIVAASCLLPMPEDKQMVSSLGFRHLSAITLSQGTDAVIIVVSAETGKVSLAVNGRWQRDLDREKLEEALTDYLLVRVDREGSDG